MNRNQLKEKHRQLNEREPFTPKEEKQFNKKDQSMIRNIQILNNFNKKQAIATIKGYKTSPKQALKALAKEYRTRLEKTSPKNKKPEIRGTPKHAKKPSKREKQVEQQNRKAVNDYLKNPKNKNQANYDKIQKGSKRYIDASKQELAHGVNSKWSQNYRERNGLPRKYNGRVVK